MPSAEELARSLDGLHTDLVAVVACAPARTQRHPLQSNIETIVRRWFAAWISAVLVAAVGSSSSYGALQTVALVGQLAPGTSGTYLGWLGFPVISNSGVVTFMAQTSNDGGLTLGETAVWQGPAASVGLAQNGVDSSSILTVNERGDFLNYRPICCWYRVPEINASIGGHYGVLATHGGAAPQSSYPFDSFSIPILTNSGIVSFFAQVTDSGGVVRGEGLWSMSEGRFQLDVGNYKLGNSTIDSFYDSLLPATANNHYQTFIANARIRQGIIEDRIFTTSSTSLSAVVRFGDRAPGTAGRFYNLGPPTVNGVGDYAFSSTLSGTTAQTSTGVWSSTRGGGHLVALSGTMAPGSTGTFGGFLDSRNFKLNARGDLLLANHVSYLYLGNEYGLWLDTGAGLKAVAVAGMQLPGLPFYFNSVGKGLITNAGDVIFLASVTGTPTALLDDRLGIWKWTAGQVSPLVRVADVLEVRPGDFRTISRLDFAAGSSSRRDSGVGSENEDGTGLSAANERGEVVFNAWFTDGSSGIFVYGVPVPEPHCPLMIVPLAVFAFCRLRWP